MHDGAGAWLKSAAARAVLSGVGISSVAEFFDFCIRCLRENATSKNFTSLREFYLITSMVAAMYRGTVPATVTGSIKIKQTRTDSTGMSTYNNILSHILHPDVQVGFVGPPSQGRL